MALKSCSFFSDKLKKVPTISNSFKKCENNNKKNKLSISYGDLRGSLTSEGNLDCPSRNQTLISIHEDFKNKNSKKYNCFKSNKEMNAFLRKYIEGNI